jgi:UDP-D-galactose:(glucosyl)LPS alpha-1,6-D-galactosyltransferase
MIKVDIVSPVGGLHGGIENVIKSWTKHVDARQVDLRVFHLASGMAYLEGYPKAYCINKPFEKADLGFCVAGYELFIKEYGAPDICIATNWPMMSLACAMVKERNHLSMKVVSWVHSKIEMYSQEGLGGLEEVLRADAHLAINQSIGQEILCADPNAKVYMIGNPVVMQDSSDYAPKPYTLAYVGRLEYIKHVDIILEAMYKARDKWHLKIIGDGEIRQDVEGWVRLLKLEDRVEFLGWKENVWTECLDTGILVMASEYEGFGLVAYEASSLGMTVISTPVDGVTDYIVPGQNGYLYPFDNADELAKLLNAIGKQELSLCDPKECRRSVMEYAEAAYFKRIHDIFSELTS